MVIHIKFRTHIVSRRENEPTGFWFHIIELIIYDWILLFVLDIRWRSFLCLTLLVKCIYFAVADTWLGNHLAYKFVFFYRIIGSQCSSRIVGFTHFRHVRTKNIEHIIIELDNFRPKRPTCQQIHLEQKALMLHVKQKACCKLCQALYTQYDAWRYLMFGSKHIVCFHLWPIQNVPSSGCEQRTRFRLVSSLLSIQRQTQSIRSISSLLD